MGRPFASCCGCAEYTTTNDINTGTRNLHSDDPDEKRGAQDIMSIEETVNGGAGGD